MNSINPAPHRLARRFMTIKSQLTLRHIAETADMTAGATAMSISTAHYLLKYLSYRPSYCHSHRYLRFFQIFNQNRAKKQIAAGKGGTNI